MTAVRCPPLLRYGQRTLLDAGSIACVSDFEAHKLLDTNRGPQFGSRCAHQFAYRDGVLPNERLFEQADLFVELAHATFSNFVYHLLRFALAQSARALDAAF